MTTRDRLTALIASHAGRDAATIGPLQTLVGDLDLDSLGRLDLRLAIEDTFSISMSDDETDDPELGTVGGLLAFVEDRVKVPLTLVETLPAGCVGGYLGPLGSHPVYAGGYRPAEDIAIDLMQPTNEGRKIIDDAIRATDLRRAFDAGVRAGRCDPNPAAAWQAFRESVGL